MWIDAERFMYWRTEQYALNRRLLKTVTIEQMRNVDGHWIATRMAISDALKRNSSTTVAIDEVEVNVRLDPNLFSLEELSW